MRAFQDEINFWTQWNQWTMWWHHLIHRGPGQNTRQKKKNSLLLFPAWLTVLRYHFFLTFDWDFHHWLFWFSGLQTWTGIMPPAFLGLWFSDGRLLAFSGSFFSIEFISSQSYFVSLHTRLIVSSFRSRTVSFAALSTGPRLVPGTTAPGMRN